MRKCAAGWHFRVYNKIVPSTTGQATARTQTTKTKDNVNTSLTGTTDQTVDAILTESAAVTARINTRLQALADIETSLTSQIAEAKRKLQDNILVDDFEMSHILEFDAKLYALMIERFALERAEHTRIHFATYHNVLEETLRQMTARLSSTRHSSTSQMSNEIHVRRHFALLERINNLRDVLTYNQDA